MKNANEVDETSISLPFPFILLRLSIVVNRGIGRALPSHLSPPKFWSLPALLRTHLNQQKAPSFPLLVQSVNGDKSQFTLRHRRRWCNNQHQRANKHPPPPPPPPSLLPTGFDLSGFRLSAGKEDVFWLDPRIGSFDSTGGGPRPEPSPDGGP